MGEEYRSVDSSQLSPEEQIHEIQRQWNTLKTEIVNLKHEIQNEENNRKRDYTDNKNMVKQVKRWLFFAIVGFFIFSFSVFIILYFALKGIDSRFSVFETRHSELNTAMQTTIEDQIKDIDRKISELKTRSDSFSVTLSTWSPMLPQEKISFISYLYKVMLERDADSSGLWSWVDAIDRYTMSANDLVYKIYYSDEFREKITTNEQFVKIAYKIGYSSFQDDPESSQDLPDEVSLSFISDELNDVEKKTPNKLDEKRKEVLRKYMDTDKFKKQCDRAGLVYETDSMHG